MLSNRALLLRQMQQFFEEHLRGFYLWQEVMHRPPEKADKIKGVRQRDKELAIIDFDGYSLILMSPDQQPPLGEILLYDTQDGQTEKGIVDEVTWARIAKIIKEKAPNRVKEPHHVHD